MRPVPDIIADRQKAMDAVAKADAEFKKLDAELRAAKSVIEAALHPRPVTRAPTE